MMEVLGENRKASFIALCETIYCPVLVFLSGIITYELVVLDLKSFA